MSDRLSVLNSKWGVGGGEKRRLETGDGSVGIVTGLQMIEVTDSISGGKEFFFSPRSSDLFLAPQSHISTGNQQLGTQS